MNKTGTDNCNEKKKNYNPLNSWNVCWEVIYKMTLEPFLIM